MRHTLFGCNTALSSGVPTLLLSSIRHVHGSRASSRKCAARAHVGHGYVGSWSAAARRLDHVFCPHLLCMQHIAWVLLRYLLFTGDCPIQQEDMERLATKGEDSKVMMSKAGKQAMLTKRAWNFAAEIGWMRGFASRSLAVGLR